MNVGIVVKSLSCGWLQSHGLQHARLPCPSLFPRVCSKSCPLSQTPNIHLILCLPLLLLLSIFTSIRVFFNEYRSKIIYRKYVGIEVKYTSWYGLVAKSRLTLVTPWTVAHQAPLSMGVSRQEYWSGLPFLSPTLRYRNKIKIIRNDNTKTIMTIIRVTVFCNYQVPKWYKMFS